MGASGDLAKKKTYPSLLHLFSENLLPKDSVIWGYARSPKTHDELRRHLHPNLIKTGTKERVVQDFLAKCYYHSGKSYGDEEAYTTMMNHVQSFETTSSSCRGVPAAANRLFYLAVPPTVFGESGSVIRQVGMAKNGGWTRVVIEKPFGKDLDSCNELLGTLAEQFEEEQLYRIDHYLGKEVVQNLLLFRFGNSVWEPIWHSATMESVTISFKEVSSPTIDSGSLSRVLDDAQTILLFSFPPSQQPFGTEGRGGYFDSFGIIRDILQNHLLQVLTLFAMEPPESDDAHSIRDAKVKVLNNMDILSLEDALLGQYDGYSDDPTIDNKDTNCPTYAALRCRIHTPRWEGVPFILEAGKALDEKLCEVRVRFRESNNLQSVGRSAKWLGPTELVLRLQPNPALELHTNIKSPGLSTGPRSTILKMNYDDISDLSNPDAYTRLLLDVLRGNQGSFVRDDELRRSWEIFTPLLHAIENFRIRPDFYKFGTQGPDNRDDWMEAMGRAPPKMTVVPQLKSSL